MGMEDLELEPEESSGSGNAWMATFGDMMTLLLCFFILLLSFATMDVVKFREALGSVQEALGVQFEHDGEFEAIASAPIQLEDAEGSGGLGDDRALLDELSAAISEEGLDNEIGAEIDGRGVVLRIGGRVLYRGGEADLRPEADAILTRVADLVKGTTHRVMIEGHTDDVPIQTARYPSNWELSTARAISAMRFLVSQDVDAQRVGVAGYADLRPIEPNDSPFNRATNRRVEFVFIRQSDSDSDENADDTAGDDASTVIEVAEDVPPLESGQEASQTEEATEPSTAGI